MQSSRRFFRLVVLAVVGFGLTACHFHHCGWAPRHCAPPRYCR